MPSAKLLKSFVAIRLCFAFGNADAEVQVHKNTAEVDEEPLLVGEELLIVDGKILETCVLCDNHEWVSIEGWEQGKDWLCGNRQLQGNCKYGV